MYRKEGLAGESDYTGTQDRGLQNRQQRAGHRGTRTEQRNSAVLSYPVCIYLQGKLLVTSILPMVLQQVL